MRGKPDVAPPEAHLAINGLRSRTDFSVSATPNSRGRWKLQTHFSGAPCVGSKGSSKETQNRALLCTLPTSDALDQPCGSSPDSDKCLQRCRDRCRSAAPFFLHTTGSSDLSPPAAATKSIRSSWPLFSSLVT